MQGFWPFFIEKNRENYLKYMEVRTDTICAIATGLTESAIGMIRVSGDESIAICDSLFKGSRKVSDMATYTAAYGRLLDIDEVVILVMKAPHSYTTEDTVEIYTHGGSFVVRKVLDAVVSAGARLAEPGEFTKRAYLGGRIDMTQAEAVMDVIKAENDMALSASIGQLSGHLKEKILGLRERLLYHTAFIEVALDDPENYSLDGYNVELKKDIEEVSSEISRLIETFSGGRIIKSGIRTAIVGRPNVGKSSLMNLLLGEDRAIVTSIEGTTRDTLEEYVGLGSITLRLIDTAGIRETEDEVETIGVNKAKDAAFDADLILYIVDGSRPFSDEDEAIYEMIRNKRYIAIISKSDLETKLDESEFMNLCKGHPVVGISVKDGEGVDELTGIIEEMFFNGDIDYNNELLITSERHKECLSQANESLERVMEGIETGMSEDLLTIDVLGAYEALGLIIGETLEDDLAEKIFSEFCMGK